MTSTAFEGTDRVGVVVIGRNEGERLLACLREVAQTGCAVVYVDSGSTDGSAAAARRIGATVVELDAEIPFTAARARNTGWRRLLQERPQLHYLQFLDGDCVPAPGWIENAAAFLEEHSDVAAVCGRLREQSPNLSIYNRLCDIEWDGPCGEIEEFGGPVMIRREALVQVDGYIETIIAAEDTDLSVRLRKAGWRLERLGREMGHHDARMTRLSQWWKRAVRSGHAHAEISSRHGDAPYRCRTRAARSCLFYGLVIPLLAAGLAWPTGGWSLLLLIVYPALALRIVWHSASRLSLRDSAVYAASCVLGKFPEAIGLLIFWWNRARGRQAHIIEYKSIPTNSEPLQA